MTVEAYSSLPLAAGTAVGKTAGRGLLWIAALYMRDPARNTAIAALLGLSVLAGGNALYKQAHHHPSPLFGSFETAPAISVVKPPKAMKPVMPADRPAQLDIDATETTGSLAPVKTTPAEIGNDDVLALQKKLAALSFFTGTADGLFGPRTSKAIKAFEQSVGRPQRGQLTQDIIDLVQAAALPVQPATQPLVASQPTRVAAAPSLSLPAPSPLLGASSTLPSAPAASDAQSASTAPSVAAKDTAAASPITKLASLDGPVDSPIAPAVAPSDPSAVPKRVVQTIPVHAETGQPMPSQLASLQDDSASTDPDTVAAVQRGLNSLGFLHGEIDGVAGEATAKAIRNFEVFYNYDVTGKVTLGLVELLKANGATI